jgi:NACHT domain
MVSTVDVATSEKRNNDWHSALNSTLDRLPYAENAPFNSYAKQHELTCLPDTRVDVLRKIHEWADGQDTRGIFWLNGLAGTGKSTIARTVAHKYSKNGASFFFSRGGGDASHAGKFVTTIAVQLANNVLSLKHYICEAITDRSDITSRSLRDQWHQLILRPLSKLGGQGCQGCQYVLVVDALDECDDNNNIRIILQLLAEARSLEKVRLRVFLTSRPEIPIRHGFYQIPTAQHQDFILHNIAPAIVDQDISKFLGYNLKIIRRECHLTSNWPCEQDIERLIQYANGLFIWMATACRFIREGRGFAPKRLKTILEGGSSAVTEPEKRLNEIYLTVLKQSISEDFTDEEKTESYRLLRHILGCVAVLLSPLSIKALGTLLDVTRNDIDQRLDGLHAIIAIPKDPTIPLRLHHPSFRDFLLDKERCGDPNFWVDGKQVHQTLTDSCIRLMSTSLKQDICGLSAPGVLVADVESSRVDERLPPDVQYACLYWIQHIEKSGIQLAENDQVHQFLETHFLHWLEALGWMRRVSEGILAISSLESIVLVSLVQHVTNMQLTYRADVPMSPAMRVCSRHEAIRPLRPDSDRTRSSASILQWAHFCTSQERNKGAVRKQNTWMDTKITWGARGLGRVATDARGP